MAKLTRAQLDKWASMLPEGWGFDVYHFCGWGEKRINIDAPANADGVFYRATLEYYPECEGSGYMRRETGRQIPTLEISRYTPEGDGEEAALYHVVRILRESVGEVQRNRNFKALAKLAGELEISAYFAKAEEQDTGKAYNTMDDFAAPEPEEAPEAEQTNEEPANYHTAPEEAENLTERERKESAIEAEIEEAIAGAVRDLEAAFAEQEAAETPVEEPETLSTENDAEPENEPQETEEDAQGRFEALALAYFTGKQAKPARKTEKKPEPEEEPTPEEPEPDESPAPGWNENDNAKFPDEERKALSCGVPVVHHIDKYNQTTTIFSAPFSDRVRLLYSVHSMGQRDNIEPGQKPDFWGFMVDGNIYSDNSTKDICRKFSADIERRLQELIPSESDAAKAAANIEGDYTRKRLEEIKGYCYTRDAKDLFFRDNRPELKLYDRPDNYSYDCIISYIIDPGKAIEESALAYLCNYPEKVYAGYIRFNRLSAAYNEIVSDTQNEAHQLKRISGAITTQKTVRISLSNGSTVKCEASAVKYMPFRDTISEWNVDAPDREKLPKNEYGRPCDIYAADIVEILHGGRVLYTA